MLYGGAVRFEEDALVLRRLAGRKNWLSVLKACAISQADMPPRLGNEGIFEEAQAVKEVVAWQLAEAIKKKKISNKKMATLLKTSSTQVDRLRNAKDDITLSQPAAGRSNGRPRVTTELV